MTHPRLLTRDYPLTDFCQLALTLGSQLTRLLCSRNRRVLLIVEYTESAEKNINIRFGGKETLRVCGELYGCHDQPVLSSYKHVSSVTEPTGFNDII